MTILVYFWSRTCGYSRRMDSLVDHFHRLHRGDVKLAKVEVADRPDLAARFGVTSTPTVILLENLLEVSRLEGRNTLPQIRAAFEPHLDIEEVGVPEFVATA